MNISNLSSDKFAPKLRKPDSAVRTRDDYVNSKIYSFAYRCMVKINLYIEKPDYTKIKWILSQLQPYQSQACPTEPEDLLERLLNSIIDDYCSVASKLKILYSEKCSKAQLSKAQLLERKCLIEYRNYMGDQAIKSRQQSD